MSDWTETIARLTNELRELEIEHKAASEAWNAVPPTWGDPPEKVAAIARLNEAAGATSRKEYEIIQTLLKEVPTK